MHRKSVPIIIINCCLLMACPTIRAQPDDRYHDPLWLRPKSWGIHAGTQGLGIDYTQGLLPRLSIRAGGSYLPFSFNYAGSFNNVASDIQLTTKHFTNAHLLANWYPFDNSGLRITPGAGYFFDAKANALVKPSGSFTYGEIPVTGDQVGTMEGEITWKGIAPYLGTGWLFNFRQGERPFSFSIDLGTYYLPAPDARLTGTKLLENNSENEEKFKKNVKNYRWLPLLQASLQYNF
jgi:hypothetical protein